MFPALIQVDKLLYLKMILVCPVSSELHPRELDKVVLSQLQPDCSLPVYTVRHHHATFAEHVSYGTTTTKSEQEKLIKQLLISMLQ
jgi:hypothetical protein